jgi:putative tryptophan/tyrosine transport system substrate-binding protein
MIAAMKRREFITLLGGAAAWPLAAQAQQPTMPVVGILNGQSPTNYATFVAAIRQGLSETGYLEGRNVAIEYRWAEGQHDRLPGLAADLVSRNVAVIVAGGGAENSATLAAKSATATIPIVFTSADDPVASGLVTAFNRPGGNLTGVTFFSGELVAKRLELLLELVPKAILVALLADPKHHFELYSREMQSAAGVLGRRLIMVTASTESDLETAFAKVVQQGASALVVSPSALFNAQRNRIVALAARYAIAAIYEQRDFALAGGLISYGASVVDAYRQAGVLAGKILQGASPAELPVLRPIKLELLINLKTARTLGLIVPDKLLVAADEVIE